MKYLYDIRELEENLTCIHNFKNLKYLEIMTNRLNLKLTFPIIVLIDSSCAVNQNEKQYTICLRSYVKTLERFAEFVIDSQGIQYKRISIKPLKNVNAFGCFQIGYGFGVCFVEKKLQKIESLSVVQLKVAGLDILKRRENYFNETLLPIERWKQEFVGLNNSDDILRYMFYFADTSRYYDPDLKDSDWKQREGFVKKR